MSTGTDHLVWLRVFWASINFPALDWRRPEQCLRDLRPAVTITDCKSLYDLMCRTALPSCEEKRTLLEILLVRERTRHNCECRWISTHLQLADGLTKVMECSLLRSVLSGSRFQIYDEKSTLQVNANRKAALRWLRERTAADA